MRYDFDLFYVGNTDASSGIVSSAGRTKLGQLRTNAVGAVFQDQETVDAVAIAPPIVRLFLEEAGFGVKETRATDCDKDQSATDPVKRRVLVHQLSSVLANRAMKKALGRVANKGEFNIHDFIAFVVAKDAPVEQAELTDLAPENKVKPRRPSQVRKSGGRRRARPV